MADLAAAIWIEARKATRSPMPLYTALGSADEDDDDMDDLPALDGDDDNEESAMEQVD